MTESLSFKPRARLLLQLGEQLIKNEQVALLELVKNSYDADARNVTITMSNLKDIVSATITIEDDGMGMNEEIIRNAWMEPGSNYKEKKFVNKERSPLGRLPIGEKGIGRFGVHKLGNSIELISKREGFPEIYLNIDWLAFEGVEYLDDIKIKIVSREPKYFTEGRTGTKIVIGNLKSQWTRGSVRNLYRSVNSLNSPFESMDSFTVLFSADMTGWLDNLLSFEDIKEYSLFKAEATIENNKIKWLEYSFTPWNTMPKLFPRTVVRENISMVTKDNQPIDLSSHSIGLIKLKMYIFDRDNKIMTFGVNDKATFNKYLDSNGGIRIYRDGLRILDYGEAENDWLGFNQRRINAPSQRLSNNIIIGAITIDREFSSSLKEKTNREGFIDNQAYRDFKEAILFAISKIETERNIDKDKIRLQFTSSQKSEPVISNLIELKDTIIQKIENKEIRDEINNYVKRIEDDYKYITDVYLRSAGAGLSLSIVVHEMEKVLNELHKVVEKEKPPKRIISLINHLANLVEGYSSIVRNSNRVSIDLKKLINQALFNVEFRLRAHNVEVIQDYSNYQSNSIINCSKNLIIAVIVNLIDNCIWWSEYAGVNNKKIYIKLTNEFNNYISIIIADNGPGFTLPTDELTKPFISDKPEGMGLGLYLANEIMKGHNGKLLFPNRGDLDIPPEFQNGATVALAFKGEVS